MLASLIDGGFFLKRFKTLFKDDDPKDPVEVAKRLIGPVERHLDGFNDMEQVSDDLHENIDILLKLQGD